MRFCAVVTAWVRPGAAWLETATASSTSPLLSITCCQSSPRWSSFYRLCMLLCISWSHRSSFCVCLKLRATITSLIFISIPAHEISVCVLPGRRHISPNQRLHPGHLNPDNAHKVAPPLGFLRQQPRRERPGLGARHAHHQDTDGPAWRKPVPEHPGRDSRHTMSFYGGSRGREDALCRNNLRHAALPASPLICNHPVMIVIGIRSSRHNVGPRYH